MSYFVVLLLQEVQKTTIRAKYVQCFPKVELRSILEMHQNNREMVKLEIQSIGGESLMIIKF